ncbi:ABC transporter substrate-binding protein [Streptomyces sp. DSM 44915]|uniref:ABC transporter substrate-binding protein n=1 Tax=Streptomyces chisholmiae TaxID=3075540 RepID=A0ABU2JUZ9_9ACTN|nr:ABC transporter substrate-binding protein [Streptomyces sp. DSM 44915]MDT0268043.1 ABC transporter substrate-binding protein [Streptomyces sp. DSM 44915]
MPPSTTAPGHGGSSPSMPPIKLPPRRGRWLLAALLGLALLAGGLWVVPDWLAGRDCGGAELTERDGECVGVSDGSPAFLPTGEAAEPLTERFREVQRLIRVENTRVADDGGAAVKVGLLSTLTPDDRAPHAPVRVLHALEGAYTAQMRANHSRQLGDPAPQIQLMLANAGSRHDKWEPAVEQLVGMTDDAAPLVAVAGLAMSSEPSRAAAARLAEHGVPLVGASASADGLNAETVPGLVRVTASNTDFVTALRGYVRGRDDLDRAVLVHDTRAPDLHVSTLTEAFRRELAEELGDNPDQPFQGTTIGESAAPALFQAAVQNVCATEADMVLFAGRTADLDAFLDSLHSRPCRDRPIVVLFAETGPVIDESEQEQLVASHITVVQASAMDPAWAVDGGANPAAPAGFADFYAAYTSHLPQEDDPAAALADGYAVANHDAVAVAVRAVRVTHAAAPETALTPGRVTDALFLLHLDNAVPAAGGTLNFAIERRGDPGGKPVPVIESPPGPTRPELYVTPFP